MATTTRVLTASVNGTVYTTTANGALEAIDTCHSGATAPTDEVANGKFWLDTTTTPGILKMYDNATWNVVVNATNVAAAGALMDSELTAIASVKALDQGVATTDSPTFANITTAGIDDNATSTAMTLDASGNLLVGKTTPSISTAGTALRGDNAGLINSARNGVTLELNRLSTDGTIQEFFKDGSTVGSIGSNTSGSRLHIGKDNVALSFAAGGSNAIIPWDSTANAVEDAALSLGGSTARFKDLYLSGGVYLGGTVSANLLDDYEEGTWSPVFSDATSGGNAATANGGKRGLYTKIGNQVTVSCASTNLDTTGMTGANDLYIQGLPFTPTSYVSPNHYWTGGTRLGFVSFNTNGFVTAYVLDAVTYVRLGETISGASIDNIICSQLTSGSADISFTMTYETT